MFIVLTLEKYLQTRLKYFRFVCTKHSRKKD